MQLSLLTDIMQIYPYTAPNSHQIFFSSYGIFNKQSSIGKTELLINNT